MLFAIANEQNQFEKKEQDVTPLTLRQYLGQIQDIELAPQSNPNDQSYQEQYFITLTNKTILWVKFDRNELESIDSWFGKTLTQQLRYKVKQNKYH